MGEDRLRYLILRCVSCGGFVTRLEAVRRWEAWEAAGERNTGLCECGARQVRPGNLTTEERAKYESLWQWFRYVILRKRDKFTRVWELYYSIKGTQLGPEYKTQ